MSDTNRERALRSLLTSQQTLLLATATLSGIPEQSYAPFVRDPAGHFYVLVSELAAHTHNLMTNSQASVMILRPESESSQLFARERVIFHCNAKEITRNEVCFSEQLSLMKEQFGAIVELLSSLDDFHLFALSPVSGRYVAGFGQAYTINTSDGSLAPLIKKHG